MAGKRAGLDGERSGLWFEFKRVLSELRPTWCLVENVPGLLSSSGGRDFGIVLSGLAECGFAGVGWRVLDSRYFGVAQRRRRVFIVGGPSRGSVAQVLSLCESCAGDSQAGRTTGEDVAKPIGASTTSFGGQRYDLDETYVARSLRAQSQLAHREDVDTYVPDVAYSVLEREYKGISQREGVTTLDAHSLRAEGFDGGEDGTGRGTPLTYAIQERAVSENLEAGPDGKGWQEGLAYTLEARHHVQSVAQASVRRLTPTECERLQGFPDGWTALEGAADGPRYRALGNAVTVSVIEYLGSRILAVRP